MMQSVDIAEDGTADAMSEAPVIGKSNLASDTAKQKEKMRAVLEMVDDEFCRQVAETIGEDADPRQIKEIIAASNTNGYLFHGIKRDEYVPDVRKHGIKPLTPEGKRGDTSYWTTGTELFGAKGTTKLLSYDSTFFHYAHSAKPGSGKMIMTIAVTAAGMFQNEPETKFKENAHIELNHVVPLEKMHLLRVVVDSDDRLSPRKNAQRAERAMLNLLHVGTTKRLEPGTETLLEIDVHGQEKMQAMRMAA